MSVHPKLRRRIFYRKDQRTYQNHEGKRYRPLRGVSGRPIIILDERLQRLADAGQKKSFKKWYDLQRKCEQILGVEYPQINARLAHENYILAQLLEAYKGGQIPLQDPVVCQAVQRIQARLKPIHSVQTIYFQYCSRNAQGVLPLRSLLPHRLILHADRYSVETTDGVALRHRLKEILGQKGLWRILPP